MNALDKLRALDGVLREQGIQDHGKEAEILITWVLGVDRVSLYARDIPVPPEISEHIDSFAARRCQGEPLQYLMGEVEFFGLKIAVGPGVLIPRPETELLVEEAVRVLRSSGKSGMTILDLCTGSGCIALALAHHFPQATVIAVDRTLPALGYARRNAVDSGTGNVHLVAGDLYLPLRQRPYDCIVSNPPYIRSADIAGLQREIRDYEPRNALDGGADGLSFYRRIIAQAPLYLVAEGAVMCEVGDGQSGDVREIASEAGFGDVVMIKDYSGIERIVVCRLTRA